MLEIVIHEEAEEEIRSTAFFYESVRSGREIVFFKNWRKPLGKSNSILLPGRFLKMSFAAI
jgi:hypothetical protein